MGCMWLFSSYLNQFLYILQVLQLVPDLLVLENNLVRRCSASYIIPLNATSKPAVRCDIGEPGLLATIPNFEIIANWF